MLVKVLRGMCPNLGHEVRVLSSQDRTIRRVFPAPIIQRSGLVAEDHARLRRQGREKNCVAVQGGEMIRHKRRTYAPEALCSFLQLLGERKLLFCELQLRQPGLLGSRQLMHPQADASGSIADAPVHERRERREPRSRCHTRSTVKAASGHAPTATAGAAAGVGRRHCG
jgi:hypothetical protein